MKKLNISQASPVTAGFDALVTALRSTLVFDEKPAFTMVGFHFFIFLPNYIILIPTPTLFPVLPGQDSLLADEKPWSGHPRCCQRLSGDHV